MLWITLYANIFYFLQNPHLPFYDTKSLFSFIIFRQSLCFHLWYLAAYVEVLFVIILALKLKQERWLWYAAPLFCLFGLLIRSYNIFLPPISHSLELARNFFTMGIPCFAIGWLLREYEVKVIRVISRPFALVLLLFAASVAELVLYRHSDVGERGDYMLFTIPLAAALVIFCLHRPDIGHCSFLAYIGKHYSLDIYIYHVFIYGLLSSFNRYIPIPQAINVCLIFVCSVAFAYIWHTAQKKYLQH